MFVSCLGRDLTAVSGHTSLKGSRAVVMRVDNKLGMDVVSALVYNRLIYAHEYDLFHSTAFFKVLLDSYLEAGNFLHLPPVVLQHSCA